MCTTSDKKAPIQQHMDEIIHYLSDRIPSKEAASLKSLDVKDLIWEALSIIFELPKHTKARLPNSTASVWDEFAPLDSIYHVLHEAHCNKGKSFFIPLIIWQWNDATKAIYLGELKAPGNVFNYPNSRRSLHPEDFLQLIHATNSNQLVDMLTDEKLQLVGSRGSSEGKQADLSTHGLVYCAVNVKINKSQYKEARYGAARITFELNPKGRRFYILGTKFYKMEVSQQLLTTKRSESDWKVMALGKDRKSGLARSLGPPLDLDTFTWDVGCGTVNSTWRWIHPEIVIEEKINLKYKGMEIEFVENHECINLGERRPLCDECEYKKKKNQRRLTWPPAGWSKGLVLIDTDSAKLALDFFAMKLVEDQTKWTLVQKLQKDHKLFKYFPRGNRKKNRFLSHIQERVKELKIYYKAAKPTHKRRKLNN